MKYILPLAFLGLLLVVGCSDANIDSFEACVDAGNPVMESYPRQCVANGQTFVEVIEDPADIVKEYVSTSPEECSFMLIHCAEGYTTFFDEQGCGCEEREQLACTQEYNPVCASVQVQCVTTPCEPIPTTFSNACEAEQAGAEFLYNGVCQEEANPEGACLSFDGTWLADYNECENMDQKMCETLGGTYDGCASACRNDPGAQMCTMQCVEVCSFS